MTNRHEDVDLILPMVPEIELKATQRAEEVGQSMELDRDKIDEVKIALIEACTNALEYSRRRNEFIRLHFGIGKEELKIQVIDQGQVREGAENRRGWSLAIMRELMDEVEIASSDNGTTVTMVKRR